MAGSRSYGVFAITALGVAAVMLLALSLVKPQAVDLHGMPLQRSAAEFTANAYDGTPVSLSGLQDKPTYLSFGYRHCSETCPAQLATLKQLYGQLGDQVNYVWISLDPASDRELPPLRDKQDFPALLELFPADNAAADTLAASYLASVKRIPGAETNGIAHSSHIYLIDTQGKLRVIYQGTQVTAAMMQQDAERLRLL
ncbi:SCO family protein [Pseudomaricurvus sp. HS19]|uniref:SCO family protein n=1 Tax=Pseudomaricurvus sp. HS19 TaxID=2692626 RepID=UPI0013703476|nr:redoxin domain-containing protein [Pseudomaricurvus sp. HS19]